MKRKNRMLRLDEDMDAWLELNVQGSINSWLVDAIKAKIALSTPQLVTPNTKRFDKLLSWRVEWVNKVDKFVDIENDFFKGMPKDYGFDDFTADARIRDIPVSIQEILWYNYFAYLHILNEAERVAFKQVLNKQCELVVQDLEAVVYKKWTVKEVLAKFDINQTYTVSDIAKTLGCDYIKALNYFKPCLLSRGYKVVAGKNAHVEYP